MLLLTRTEGLQLGLQMIKALFAQVLLWARQQACFGITDLLLWPSMLLQLLVLLLVARLTVSVALAALLIITTALQTGTYETIAQHAAIHIYRLTMHMSTLTEGLRR